MTLPFHILPPMLADDESGIIKIAVFVIFGVIWAVGALLSWIQKQKKQQEQAGQQAPPDWGSGPVVMSPQSEPVPVAVPPPMPRQQQQPRQQNRKREKQARRQQKEPPRSAPLPMPEPMAIRSASAPVVHAAEQSTGSTRRARSNAVGKNVRMMLQPAGVREAFVLSELLGKPKGME